MVSVPCWELTCPEKLPSMRRDDLNVTSPVNFTTSPTNPSQLSLGMFIPGARSLLVATARVLTAILFLFSDELYQRPAWHSDCGSLLRMRVRRDKLKSARHYNTCAAGERLQLDCSRRWNDLRAGPSSFFLSLS